MGTQKTIIFRPKYLNKNNSKSVRWDFDINKSKFIEKDPSKKKVAIRKKKFYHHKTPLRWKNELTENIAFTLVYEQSKKKTKCLHFNGQKQKRACSINNAVHNMLVFVDIYEFDKIFSCAKLYRNRDEITT